MLGDDDELGWLMPESNEGRKLSFFVLVHSLHVAG